MIFYNERGNQIDINSVEFTEQEQARTYVPANAKVLELGARYGSVTCILSKCLSDPKNLVSVEPDSRVWKALDENMTRNGCSAHIVRGFISKKRLSLTAMDSWDGYGTTSQPSETSTIPNYTLDEIQQRYKIVFDTLVADCEGFLEQFFDENPTFYDQLKLILFEKDYPQKCNYTKIENELKKRGFICVVSAFQSVWKR